MCLEFSSEYWCVTLRWPRFFIRRCYFYIQLISSNFVFVSRLYFVYIWNASKEEALPDGGTLSTFAFVSKFKLFTDLEFVCFHCSSQRGPGDEGICRCIDPGRGVNAVHVFICKCWAWNRTFVSQVCWSNREKNCSWLGLTLSEEWTLFTRTFSMSKTKKDHPGRGSKSGEIFFTKIDEWNAYLMRLKVQEVAGWI